MSTEAGTAVGTIRWHDLVTNDVAAAKDFYSGLLGWESEIWKPGEMDYPMIMVGGLGHGGFVSPPPEVSSNVPSHWLAHVTVESLDETLKRTEAGGGIVVVPPREIPEVGRLAVITYPETAAISAFEPLAEAPTGTGTFLWDELLADDVEAATAFYGDVFGWTAETMDMESMGMGTGSYTIFKAGDRMVAGLMKRPDNVSVQSWMTYLNTEDVDASLARVAGLGGMVLAPAFDVPTVGRIAMIADPTGATVGIMTPSTPES